MPFKQRPHLAWIVRFVPLAMVIVACTVLLILPATRDNFIAGIKRKWEGEKTWTPVTSLIPEDEPMRRCGPGLSLCTTVGALENDPEGRPVIERHLPGFWVDQALPAFRSEQLGDVLARRGVSPRLQRRIDFDLAGTVFERRRREVFGNRQEER